MPPSNQPEPYRKAQLLGLAVAVLITGGTVLYLRHKPSRASSDPSSGHCHTGQAPGARLHPQTHLLRDRQPQG